MNALKPEESYSLLKMDVKYSAAFSEFIDLILLLNTSRWTQYTQSKTLYMTLKEGYELVNPYIYTERHHMSLEGLLEKY